MLGGLLSFPAEKRARKYLYLNQVYIYIYMDTGVNVHTLRETCMNLLLSPAGKLIALE